MTFRAGLYEYILSGEEFEDNAARRACSKSQLKGYEMSRRRVMPLPPYPRAKEVWGNRGWIPI